MQQPNRNLPFGNLDSLSEDRAKLKCPFNSKHRVEPRIFANHIEKCRRRMPREKLRKFCVCRYNSLHIFSIYQIGAHEIACANKKRMLELSKNMSNDSQLLNEQISQSCSSQSKYHQAHSTQLDESCRIQTFPNQQQQQITHFNINNSRYVLNYQSEIRSNQYPNQLLLNYNRQQQNDYDTYQPDINFSYYQNLDNTEKQVANEKQTVLKQQSAENSQTQISYNYKMTNMKQNKQLAKHGEERSTQNIKQQYHIKQQIKQMKAKEINKFNNNNIQKQNLTQNIQKNYYTQISQNKILNRNNHIHKFLQKSLNQCQSCQNMLTNPDNKLWKHKKLVKYLKAYNKLQQQEAEIKQFLKYVPKTMKQPKLTSNKEQVQFPGNRKEKNKTTLTKSAAKIQQNKSEKSQKYQNLKLHESSSSKINKFVEDSITKELTYQKKLKKKNQPSNQKQSKIYKVAKFSQQEQKMPTNKKIIQIIE